ncbi:MAG: 2-amino-4-hydroxy-6-hydroxymethyldihydropteridine diphosphokinase [Salinibacterium sp.]|nr:2-amino-4-hydroxy-6-hydroxymethyldihydropteridine diphosphokinase [Salinibacterium sp.]
MSHAAVLALGSNLGDREQIIRAGIRDIAALPGVVVTGASGLVETPALTLHGIDTDAPTYLNAVLTVRTTLDPHELLHALNGVETEHGRVRNERWGDRTLDIDIIDVDGVVIASDDLTVPHPRAHERAFVLAPWLQIVPDATLPGFGRADALLAATGQTPFDYPAEPLL